MGGLNDHKLVLDEIENIQATLIRADMERLKVAVDAKIKASDGAKRLNTASVKITKGKIRGRTSIRRGRTSMIPLEPVLQKDSSGYFLFEFAFGYALFYAHRVHELDMVNFESHDKYINRSDSFTLKAFHPFSSISDALFELDTISNSMVTPHLRNFLVDNLPKRIPGKSSYYLATGDPILGHNILVATGIERIAIGVWSCNLMRGLRMNIHKFIDGLEPKDLEKQQLNLARLYIRQRCSTIVGKSSKAISSSSLQQLVVGPHRGRQRPSTMVAESSKLILSSSFKQFVVVPHRFEGVFIAKGKEEDFICTRNLVPGEALYGEELIYVQNEDGTEVEYRVWNPLKSKLAAAILCGVKNIWVKPGSRVLYLGDVCEVTVALLSDLVGMDGLVYVVGWSNDVVNMAEKWSNVITILEKPLLFRKHRMIVGMVDVIFSDIVYPDEVDHIANHASLYLKAGGHYMISTPANNIDSTRQDEFANHLKHKEFKPIEVVMLGPIVREYAMVVGGFRVGSSSRPGPKKPEEAGPTL